MEEIKIKDKVIIAVYIPVGNMSSAEVDDYVSRINSLMPKDDSVLYYIFPIKEGAAKAECIYPVFITNDDIVSKTHNVLDRLIGKINEDGK